MITEPNSIRQTIKLKSLVRNSFRLAYLVMLLCSLAIFIKPGASIFYKKLQIPVDSLAVIENAFQFTLKINQKLFNLKTLLVLENQKVLDLSSTDVVASGEYGTFTFNEMNGNSVDVLFVPSTPTSGAVPERVYYVGIRPFFVTRACGLWGSILFGLGLILYLLLPRLFSQQPGSRFTSTATWWKQQLKCRSGGIFIALNNYYVLRKSLLKLSASGFVLVAFFYVFMEWIFFVTKPSFMDILGLLEKIRILLLSGLIVSLFALAILAAILFIDAIASPVLPSIRRFVTPLPVVLMIASLGLLLIDNFTYTVFKFGVATSTSGLRMLYALAFLGISIVLYKEVAAWMATSHGQKVDNWYLSVAGGLLAISLVLAGFSFKPNNDAITSTEQDVSSDYLPNIILLSSDGLNAANMSVYGYARDTTPFMRDLARTSLVGQNHFSNAGSSLGSETALLTGKMPFTTRVLYSPDTLKGTDMYQHLPGLLRMKGYRTVSLGVPFYVDVNNINFQNAFDAVNCQANTADAKLNQLSDYGYDNEIYFLSTLGDRISDRLRHIFFIEEMENPYQLVTQDERHSLSDLQRLDCFYYYLDQVKTTGQPLFAHIHLMGTHGSKFSPTRSVFSEGKVQDEAWMTDFYDDAILDFDTVVRETVERLKQNNQYDNTLLAIYTDHAQRYVDTNRTPLIIHFPFNQHQGTIMVNTQTIDVAPTILDYLNIDKPDWMEGDSLLGSLDTSRKILIAHHIKSEPTSGEFFWAVPGESVKPPFYQFGKITAVQCQKFLQYNLTSNKKTDGVVSDYINPCPTAELDSAEMLWEAVGQYLTRQGFELPPNW